VPPLRVVRQGFPRPPERDTAVSHALLRRVAAGVEPETLRLHRPGSIVAFGPKDRLSPGFGDAVEAARSRGFGAVLRLAGGRAAVFHEETIAFSWAIPDELPRAGIRNRFDVAAGILADAFRDLGVEARVGEVPGEYCPGDHSVNARGKTKLMGVGQRLIRGAAHVGGVVVVGGSDRVRDVLIPVYGALSLEWDPATVGSLQDEVAAIGWDDAVEAILGRFAARYGLVEERLTADTLAEALGLEAAHRVSV
jgi:octanoyl-[GcvH]:protein N-octanoyltransferase